MLKKNRQSLQFSSRILLKLDQISAFRSRKFNFQIYRKMLPILKCRKSGRNRWIFCQQLDLIQAWVRWLDETFLLDKADMQHEWNLDDHRQRISLCRTCMDWAFVVAVSIVAVLFFSLCPFLQDNARVSLTVFILYPFDVVAFSPRQRRAGVSGPRVRPRRRPAKPGDRGGGRGGGGARAPGGGEGRGQEWIERMKVLLPNFRRLVLFCMDSYDSESRLFQIVLFSYVLIVD